MIRKKEGNLLWWVTLFCCATPKIPKTNGMCVDYFLFVKVARPTEINYTVVIIYTG